METVVSIENKKWTQEQDEQLLDFVLKLKENKQVIKNGLIPFAKKIGKTVKACLLRFDRINRYTSSNVKVEKEEKKWTLEEEQVLVDLVFEAFRNKETLTEACKKASNLFGKTEKNCMAKWYTIKKKVTDSLDTNVNKKEVVRNKLNGKKTKSKGDSTMKTKTVMTLTRWTKEQDDLIVGEVNQHSSSKNTIVRISEIIGKSYSAVNQRICFLRKKGILTKSKERKTETANENKIISIPVQEPSSHLELPKESNKNLVTVAEITVQVPMAKTVDSEKVETSAYSFEKEKQQIEQVFGSMIRKVKNAEVMNEEMKEELTKLKQENQTLKNALQAKTVQAEDSKKHHEQIEKLQRQVESLQKENDDLVKHLRLFTDALNTAKNKILKDELDITPQTEHISFRMDKNGNLESIK